MKYRQRNSAPQLKSERDERTQVLAELRIRILSRIGVSEIGKSIVALPQEKRNHQVNKFRRAVSMELAIKDRRRSNTAAKFNKKTVGERR